MNIPNFLLFMAILSLLLPQISIKVDFQNILGYICPSNLKVYKDKQGLHSLAIQLLILLGCTHCTGRSVVTVPITLTLSITCIVPIVSPFNPFPTPREVIVRGFFALFHIVYEVHQPYTLISFIHPLPSLSYTPHTMYLFYSPVFHY
jgi:hypothetical protein